MNRITFPLFAFLLFSNILVAQVDTVPPVIMCKQILEVPPLYTCGGTYWVADFVDTMYDDQSSYQNIQLGIRKKCTGSGFPENSTQIHGEILEPLNLEIWARDTAGNTSFCHVNTIVSDPSGVCDPGFGVDVSMPTNQGIKNVSVVVKGGNCLGDSLGLNFISIVTNQNGHWSSFGSTTRPGYTTHITPSKNINPLNGVSTNDLVLISKHILGIQPLDSPYKLIAADANQDGKITTTDIVVLRKLILGIANELPNGRSWRFMPQNYTFPNPLNPFQPPFPERIEVPNTADPAPSYFSFKGVKIGDVDFSADPGQ